MSRLIYVAVTIAAVQTDLVHMFGVTKGDWLHWRIPDAGILRSHVISHPGCGDTPQNHQVDDDLERELV